MITQREKFAFKQKLKQWGLDLIGQRIATANEAMTRAQEAANSEEKSSAGDKYETGRAMGHLQKDMHARAMAQSVKELAALNAIPSSRFVTTRDPAPMCRPTGLGFLSAPAWANRLSTDSPSSFSRRMLRWRLNSSVRKRVTRFFSIRRRY